MLAEPSRRDHVPAIWLSSFEQRGERERARWRLFLVRKRSSLKHRVHAQLLAFGHACPLSELFGRSGRELLERLDFPDPWRDGVLAAVAMIDELDREITGIDRELKRLGADHPYVPLLMTALGIAWILSYTIAAEIGDIHRLPRRRSCAATPACARARLPVRIDRWLMEAATHASRHPVYRDRYELNKARLGQQRGAKVAPVDIARRLAEAICQMLSRNQPLARAGATQLSGRVDGPL